MSSMSSYDDEIAVTTDGITIGGQPVPGTIAAHGITVHKSGMVPAHWFVSVVFMTGREPTIGPGLELDDDGEVITVPKATQ